MASCKELRRAELTLWGRNQNPQCRAASNLQLSGLLTGWLLVGDSCRCKQPRWERRVRWTRLATGMDWLVRQHCEIMNRHHSFIMLQIQAEHVRTASAVTFSCSFGNALCVPTASGKPIAMTCRYLCCFQLESLQRLIGRIAYLNDKDNDRGQSFQAPAAGSTRDISNGSAAAFWKRLHGNATAQH